MTFTTLRRLAATLALAAPLTAAHPTERPAPPAPEAFAETFAAFDAVPAPAVAAPVARDEPADIAHDHADAEGVTPLAGGAASYYAAKFHGRRTASGERFDNSALTAAHRTLPFGSKVRVTNPANGQSVVVRINDRGPFHKGRTIDVSHAAAKRLGLIARGHGQVDLALLN